MAIKRKCSFCGAPVKDGVEVCQYCDQRLEGNEVKPSSLFLINRKKNTTNKVKSKKIKQDKTYKMLSQGSEKLKKRLINTLAKTINKIGFELELQKDYALRDIERLCKWVKVLFSNEKTKVVFFRYIPISIFSLLFIYHGYNTTSGTWFRFIMHCFSKGGASCWRIFNLINCTKFISILIASNGLLMLFINKFNRAKYDYFISFLSILCGSILFLNGWRLEAILVFSQFLLYSVLLLALIRRKTENRNHEKLIIKFIFIGGAIIFTQAYTGGIIAGYAIVMLFYAFVIYLLFSIFSLTHVSLRNGLNDFLIKNRGRSNLSTDLLVFSLPFLLLLYPDHILRFEQLLLYGIAFLANNQQIKFKYVSAYLIIISTISLAGL